MRKIYVLGSLLLVLCFAESVKAQVDPHFSQYYVYPSWMNPALTGAFDGKYKVSAIYRNQWGNISSPFATPGVTAEFTTEKNVNVGISVLSQKAGDGGYSYTTAYASVAYTGVRFGPGETKRLVFGLQAGMIDRRFDRSKLTFGDQWNPITGYNPGATSAESLSRTSTSNLDASFGVLYFDAQPGKKANFFAGASAAHLTQPDDKFSASGTTTFPMRYTVHGGVRLTVNEVFSITPNFLFLKQRTAQEKMLGAYGQYKVNEETNLLLGINYRYKDAVVPFLGFTYKNMMLGASYDVNASDLGKITKGANAFEISLSFIGRKVSPTPEIEFVCPRL
jgi:type IX secretion system PorP/SprF family membrane protein